MKMLLTYISILIFPFFLMVAVNETYRAYIKEKPISMYPGAINSGQKIWERCSWVCHESTSYCKDNHVKFVRPYFKLTDTMYFGLIRGLRSTGGYQAANVFFLVLIFPLLMWMFMAGSIRYQYRINSIRRK
jgi:hypothetical protein